MKIFKFKTLLYRQQYRIFQIFNAHFQFLKITFKKKRKEEYNDNYQNKNYINVLLIKTYLNY